MIVGFDGSRAFGVGRTGTENYSYQLLKNLAKIDQVNHYIVYLRPPGIQENVLREWPKNFQFKVINWPKLWTQVGLAVQTFKDDLDALFVPAHTLPIFRKPGLKTVVTVHDLGSEYLPSMHQVKQRMYLGFMQKYQLKTAAKLIAVSKATKEDLVKRAGIEPEKVSVIYEGYDREKFKVPAEGETRQGRQSSKFKINQTIKKYNLIYQNYFLFVGTVQPRKNLERLIKAFNVIARSETTKRHHEVGSTLGVQSSLGNKETLLLCNNPTQIASLPLVARNDEGVKLVIAGSKGWLSDNIYVLPKQLGIEDRVKFLGYVPEKDLPALYSGALALTFPSLFEGFGLPILEAQACGCPVLTSNVSSMPEVGGEGAVYVDPYSIDDIVEGMRKCQMPNFKFQIVKAGFENIKRFSWEKCAEETLQVLEKTI